MTETPPRGGHPAGRSAREATDIIRMTAPDGRLLLRIGPDGEVEGALEDMSEAARAFVQCLREVLGGEAVMVNADGTHSRHLL